MTRFAIMGSDVRKHSAYPDGGSRWLVVGRPLIDIV